MRLIAAQGGSASEEQGEGVELVTRIRLLR